MSPTTSFIASIATALLSAGVASAQLETAAPAFAPFASLAPSPGSVNPVVLGGAMCSDQCSDAAPCYMDPTCSEYGGLGCNAHGAGMDCRFCGKGEWQACELMVGEGGGPAEEPQVEDTDCGMDAETALMLLQGFDKSVFYDESCLSGESGLLCNYLGMGQVCRGCWMTCEGAAAGMVTYPDFTPETIIFCPSSGLTSYSSDCA